MKDDPDVPIPAQAGGADFKRMALERIVKLYLTWDQAAPNRGHAEQAAEWRARLDDHALKMESIPLR